MGGDREHQGGSHLALVGQVLFGADDLVQQFITPRVPGFAPRPNNRCLGIVDKSNTLIAGVAYSDFNGKHVQATIAAVPKARWATRRTLQALFGYPFKQLGCEAITVLVASTNLPSLNLATKLGFEPEAYVKFAAHDGSTLIILKMFRNNCKWARSDDGQRRRRRTGCTGSMANSGSSGVLEQA